MAPPIVLRIERRDDGKFVTKSPNPNDNPLGVGANLNQAIGAAVREATALSREARCPVTIMVEQQNGRFKREQIVNPPVAVRRRSGPVSLTAK
jgi:hypothetical protein